MKIARTANLLAENEVPWVNLWDEENRNSPVAVREYGISAMPTLILLDKEGKVISLEARGLILGKLLAKYLGPPPRPLDGTTTEYVKKGHELGRDWVVRETKVAVELAVVRVGFPNGFGFHLSRRRTFFNRSACARVSGLPEK